MKLLKVLMYAVIALVLVFVLGGLMLPARTHVERSITIQRPPGDVHAVLNSYRRFNEWSPWFDLDPQAKYVYGGPAAGVGASLAWSGQRVGSGSQRIVESVPGQKIVNALDFDGSQAVGTFVLVPADGGTRVTWSLDSDHGHDLTARWFGLLLDRLVGADYEKGLAKLKSVLETDRPR